MNLGASDRKDVDPEADLLAGTRREMGMEMEASSRSGKRGKSRDARPTLGGQSHEIRDLQVSSPMGCCEAPDAVSHEGFASVHEACTVRASASCRITTCSSHKREARIRGWPLLT